MGKSNTEQLKIAAKYLGQGGAIFRKFCGLPSGAAWCDAYVSYIFNEAGNASLFCGGKKQTYCPNTIKILQKELAQVPLYLAMPSDVILFDWDKNGVPNHIGFVRSKVSTSSINTIEGNTSNKVMYKTRPAKYVCGIFRPHFKPTSAYSNKPLAIDGDYGFQSIYTTQKVLGGLTVDGILGKATVKRIQAYFGASPQDGAWGKNTSRCIQTKLAKEGYYTGKIDSDFGPASVKGLQRFLNAKLKTTSTTTKAPAATTTNAQKIVNKANELAWPYGTSSSKWDYKKGAPTAKCKAAMKKYGYTTKGKMSSCAYFCNTVVRSSGVNKSFGSLHGYKKPFPKTETGFNTVLSGKAIPSGFLKAGDIVRYKKTSKDEHVLIYMGNNRICEARHYHRFGNIYKDEKRYNGSNIKKSTIQVLRAK